MTATLIRFFISSHADSVTFHSRLHILDIDIYYIYPILFQFVDSRFFLKALLQFYLMFGSKTERNLVPSFASLFCFTSPLLHIPSFINLTLNPQFSLYQYR
jgi:hypothetical protein